VVWVQAEDGNRGMLFATSCNGEMTVAQMSFGVNCANIRIPKMLRRAGTFSEPADSISMIPAKSDAAHLVEAKWKAFIRRESYKRHAFNLKWQMAPLTSAGSFFEFFAATYSPPLGFVKIH
jgi:hypothetical protein